MTDKIETPDFAPLTSEHETLSPPNLERHHHQGHDLGRMSWFEREISLVEKPWSAVESDRRDVPQDYTHKAVETREQIGKVWNTGQLAVTANPQTIPRIDGQRSVTVRNIGSSAVFVAPSNATSYSGFQIDAGAAITLDVDAGVSVACAQGATSQVCYLTVAHGALS